MQALEVGAQLATPHVEAKTTLFHHHGRNMIDWVMDTSLGDAAVWQSVNHTRINTTGLEISLTTQFSPLTAHLSYTYLSQDKHLSDGLVSQYALEYLRHKLVATIQAPLWRNLSGRLGLRWQDRKGTYTTFSGDLCPYRPYALMDARLSWTQSRITLYAEASNLLNNRSYVDFGNVPQPGRWLVVGFSWRYVNLP